MARSKTSSCLFSIFLFNYRYFLLLLFNVSYHCTNIVTDIIHQFRLWFAAGNRKTLVHDFEKKKLKNDRPTLPIFFHLRATQQFFGLIVSPNIMYMRHLGNVNSAPAQYVFINLIGQRSNTVELN